MKAIKWTWFNNSRGSIGVVLAENEYGQRAYISSVEGHNETNDVNMVMEWGSSLSQSQAEGFFPGQVDSERYGKD